MKSFSHYQSAVGEIGYVEKVSQSLLHVNGLPGVKPGEIVIFENGVTGQTLGIAKDQAEILAFSRSLPRVGSQATRTNEFLAVELSPQLVGRTLNAFGKPTDGKSDPIEVKERRPLEIHPPGITSRSKVQNFLETGIAIVDLLVPLGKGQRELVIGDRKTGKTTFLREAVVTSAKRGLLCIYAAIGKKISDIKDLETHFQNNDVRNNLILIHSGSQEPASIVHLTPYTAMTIAEYFRDLGRDVLLILDDLSTHAKFYRETSLLARRFPGRDSYPGDIFYIHSRLLERAGNFKIAGGKDASITCLPVVETIEGDMTGYIPTNLMSMTDGHIFFDSNIFGKGRRPAINHSLSVTRVGRQTQTQVKHDIHRELTTFLSLYERSESFAHFSAGLSESVKFTLRTGEKIYSFFDQQGEQLIPEMAQVFLFALLWRGFWQDKPVEAMKKDLDNAISLYQSNSEVSDYITKSVTEAENFNALLKKVDDERDKIKGLLNLT